MMEGIGLAAVLLGIALADGNPLWIPFSLVLAGSALLMLRED